MVIGQAAPNGRTEQQHRQQHRRNNHVGLTGHMPDILHRTTLIPLVNAYREHEIIDQRVADGGLDLRHHAAGLLALGVFGPRAPVLLDHPDQLHVAGHDGGDCHDEPRAQHEVSETRDVEEGGGVREAGGEEGGFDDLSGQAIQDVEAPAEGQEGDGEVHEGRVDGLSGWC